MECFDLKVVIVMAFLLAYTSAGNFIQDVKIAWGDWRGQIKNGGQLLSLSLDKQSGSGFESKNSYLYSRFDMQIKLVPGNSAGTVTTFYLSSQGASHDEVDFEFLGNSSGQPYTLSTNIFAQGVGNREQRFNLIWFDPTAAFHTYTIFWNPQRIILLVDNTPIRVYTNYIKHKVPFPTSQPMKMYASLWNADDWATQGGTVKTDWSKAPFTAYYQNLNIRSVPRLAPGLSVPQAAKLKLFQRKYMSYNYCDDVKRFPKGLPRECGLPILF